MDVKKDRSQIEAIKLAIEALPKDDVSIKETVESSISWLLQNYSCTGQKRYLHSALLHLSACLELGLWSEMDEGLSDRVLRLNEVEKEGFFSQYGRPSKRLRLSKNRIRTVIGRWRRGIPDDVKLDDVVDDIYEKMLRSEKESSYYVSHLRTGDIFCMYELIISENDHILHDVIKKKFYSFEVGEKDAGRVG